MGSICRSSARVIKTAAVNILVTEPIRKSVSGVAGGAGLDVCDPEAFRKDESVAANGRARCVGLFEFFKLTSRRIIHFPRHPVARFERALHPPINPN